MNQLGLPPELLDVLGSRGGFPSAYDGYLDTMQNRFNTTINDNPDDPRHFYDYRGLYQQEGAIRPDEAGHLPSRFKQEGHPRTIVDGMNTKTGEPANRIDLPPELLQLIIMQLKKQQQQGQPGPQPAQPQMGPQMQQGNFNPQDPRAANWPKPYPVPDWMRGE